MKKVVYAEMAPWGRGVSLHVGVRRDDGSVDAMRPGALERVEVGEYFGSPTMELAHDEAQNLMDELWRCGLRPSEGTGSAGSLAATERHLKDMQEIAKGLLKKTGVEL